MIVQNIDFGGNLFLAPMAGVSDVGFREVCCLSGADVTCSEMLSARAMFHNPRKTAFMTILSCEEKVKIGQIFGHEEDIMVKAIENPIMGKYDIIDLNMGCPAPKIVKNGDGVALMKDLKTASQIIRECVKASTKPVSVKFRLGISDDISLQFGRMCEESGASFVTLHSRTAEAGYSGKADYEAIARLKSSLKIPVVGNGDVTDCESYKKMIETGVDGVMIGRGALGKPYIFSQLKGEKPQHNLFDLILRHVEVLRKHYDEDWLVKYMRKHFLWYASSLKGENRIKLATASSIEEALELIKSNFKEEGLL